MYYSRPRGRRTPNNNHRLNSTDSSGVDSSSTSVADVLYNGTLPNRVVERVRVHPSLDRLAYHAFRGCRNLKHLQLDDSIALTHIGMGALEGCVSLETLKLPPTLQVVDNEAFVDSGLTQMDFPDSVRVIGEYALKNNQSLRSVRLPANPQLELQIGLCAGCIALTDVTIPHGLTCLAGSSFKLCKSLARIQIPASVQSIDQWAFLNCQSLVRVEFETSYNNNDDDDTACQLQSLGSNVFNNCTALKSITLPNSVISIGERCFFYCTSLAVVHLPQNAQLTIGEMAFRLCPSLFRIRLPESWTPRQQQELLQQINQVDNLHQFTNIGINQQGERSLLQPLPLILWPRLLGKSRTSRIWSNLDRLGMKRETSASTRTSVAFQLLKRNVEELVVTATTTGGDR